VAPLVPPLTAAARQLQLYCELPAQGTQSFAYAGCQEVQLRNKMPHKFAFISVAYIAVPQQGSESEDQWPNLRRRL
jgi:hypothetical protein